MHEYYQKNAPKLKKAMNGLLKPIASELERRSGRSYADVFALISILISHVTATLFKLKK